MSAYLDIIFLLIVAVIIFARLRNVLGTRPEQNNEVRVVSHEEFEKIKQEVEKIISTSVEHNEPVDVDNLQGVDKVLYQIPHFNRKDFCSRCSKVFEMVLTAFAACDEETLKMLTGKKLFDGFQKIISERKADDLTIADAKISSKGIASIVVKFISEQINLLKNAAGEVIEGDENFVQQITDVWTFEKDINSNTPVWLLVSTKKN